jgi:Fuc2NAc and GlcNAc transferase
MLSLLPAIGLVTQQRLALLLTVCAGLGILGASFMGHMPFREHLLDRPNERSSHTVPTPRGGGVGILAAFIAAGLALQIPATFLCAAAFLSMVSFYGDYFPLSVKIRLLVQLVAALILLLPLWPGLAITPYVSFLSNLSPASFYLLLPLLLLFMIGTANLYNFMDGINGIAGISGAIGFGLLGFHTLGHSTAEPYQTSFSVLSIALALACLGFLPFNMPRAKVFMGDVGSILLGFVFAGLALMLSLNFLGLVCFAALLFPFYADELTTMAVRLRDGEKLTQSHRRHLYQILANELGMAHWKISALYGMFQLAVGIGVLCAYPFGFLAVLLFLAACFAGFILLTACVRKSARKREVQSRP